MKYLDLTFNAALLLGFLLCLLIIKVDYYYYGIIYWCTIVTAILFLIKLKQENK